MKSALHTGSTKRAKDRMKRGTQITLALCLAVFGTAIQARADCQNVVGSMTETIIRGPNDPYGRTLGIVTGVLNGASTAVVTSPDGSTSYDVIVTNRGDMLTGTGSITLTPIPGNSSDFTVNVILTITGGSGKYSGATGKLTYMGLAQFPSATTGTFNLIYRGSACGPNIKAEGN
jgi:hypothetical protein